MSSNSNSSPNKPRVTLQEISNTHKSNTVRPNTIRAHKQFSKKFSKFAQEELNIVPNHPHLLHVESTTNLPDELATDINADLYLC